MKICKLELGIFGKSLQEIDLEITRVRFRISEDRYIDMRIMDNDSIEVRSSSESTRIRLSCARSAGNCFDIQFFEEK